MQNQQGARLEVNLLGKFSVKLDGKPITNEIAGKGGKGTRLQLLFLYLLLNLGNRVLRKSIENDLSLHGANRTLLDQVLSKLKKALRDQRSTEKGVESFILSERIENSEGIEENYLCWNKNANFFCDYWAFEEAYKAFNLCRIEGDYDKAEEHRQNALSYVQSDNGLLVQPKDYEGEGAEFFRERLQAAESKLIELEDFSTEFNSGFHSYVEGKDYSEDKLIGRESEQQKITRVWQECTDDIAPRATLFIIRGAEGVGKTALAESCIQLVTELEGPDVIIAKTYRGKTKQYQDYHREAINDWRKQLKIHESESTIENKSTKSQHIFDDIESNNEVFPPSEYEALIDYTSNFYTVGKPQRRLPVLLFIDDIQRTSEHTINWIRYLISEPREIPLMILATMRFRESVSPQALGNNGVLQGLDALSTDPQALKECVYIEELSNLNREDAFALACQETNLEEIPSDLHDIFMKSTLNGNPFWITFQTRRQKEEVYLTYLNKRKEDWKNGHRLTVEEELSQELWAGIYKQLTDQTQKLAGLLSIALNGVSYSTLQAGIKEIQLSRDELHDALNELNHLKVVEELHGIYRFTHDIYRDFFYQRVDPLARRDYHNFIVEDLRAKALDQYKDNLPIFAYHLAEAKRYQEAIDYYEKVFNNLSGSSQFGQERITLRKIIEIIDIQCELLDSTQPPHIAPDKEEKKNSLLLQKFSFIYSLLPCEIALFGYASNKVSELFDLQKKLSQATGTQLDFRFLIAEGNHRVTRSDMVTAEGIIKSIPSSNLSIVNKIERGILIAIKNFYSGELNKAKEHLDRLDMASKSILDSNYAFFSAHNPLVLGQGLQGIMEWFIGNPENALTHIENAIWLADRDRRIYDQVSSRFLAAWYYQLCGVPDRVKELTQTSIELCVSPDGILRFWLPIHQALHGWSIAMLATNPEEFDRGIHELKERTDDYLETGGRLAAVYWWLLPAELCYKKQRYELALRYLDEAKKYLDQGDAFYNAEFYRFSALISRERSEEEQTIFPKIHRSLQIAEQQGNQALEFRTLISLLEIENKGKISRPPETKDAKKQLDLPYSRLMDYKERFMELREHYEAITLQSDITYIDLEQANKIGT